MNDEGRPIKEKTRHLVRVRGKLLAREKTVENKTGIR